jgi:hypothetical protein
MSFSPLSRDDFPRDILATAVNFTHDLIGSRCLPFRIVRFVAPKLDATGGIVNMPGSYL